MTRAAELADLVAQAESWQAWAARMNAKAIAAGIVDAETVHRNRSAAQAALGRLRAELARLNEGEAA